jgi:hypothetical protein
MKLTAEEKRKKRNEYIKMYRSKNIERVKKWRATAYQKNKLKILKQVVKENL